MNERESDLLISDDWIIEPKANKASRRISLASIGINLFPFQHLELKKRGNPAQFHKTLVTASLSRSRSL